MAAHGDHVYCLSNISKQPKTLNRFHVPSQTWSLEPLPKEIAESGTYSLTTDARGLWAVQKTQTILLPYESTQPVIMQNPCIIHTRTMVVHDGDWLWVHCGQFTPSTAPAASRGVFSSHLFLIDKRAPAILGRVDLGDDRQPVGLVVTPQWVCPVIDTQPHKTSPLLKLDKAQVLKAARALP